MMIDLSVKGLNDFVTSLEEVRKEAKDAEEKYKKYSKREPIGFDNRSGLKRSNQYGDGFANKRPFTSNGSSAPSLNRSRQETENSLLSKVATPIRPIDMRDFLSSNRSSRPTNVGLSSVVEVAKQPTRTERLRAMESSTNKHSKEDVERGRRMMNLMLGRLHAFKTEVEQEKGSTRNIQRQELQERVLRQGVEKQEEYIREKEQLERAQRDVKHKLRRMEAKHQAAKAFTTWAEHQNKMKNYIRTSFKPYVFYRPKQCNEEATKRIEETRRVIKEDIQRRKQTLEDDIAHLTSFGHDKGSVSNEAARLSDHHESHSSSGEAEDLTVSLHGDSFSEGEVDDYSAPLQRRERSNLPLNASESIGNSQTTESTDNSHIREVDDKSVIQHSVESDITDLPE